MKSLLNIVLVACFAGFVVPAYAQVPEQDVIILKDNTILRGTIQQKVTPGSAVLIQKTSGKTASILWSEILTIRRLPVSLSDSAITVLFVGEEDVLALNSGTLLRGTLVESSQKGTVGFVPTGKDLILVQKSDINKTLHLEKGLSDSTIEMLYVHPPPEMIADDFRVLTIFGGFGIAGGEFSAPTVFDAGAASSGYGVGLHVSIRVVPSIRWATTAIYGGHTMDLPEPINSWSSSGSYPVRLIWALTGLEVRSEGTQAIKAFGFIQGGILDSKINGENFSFPAGFNHSKRTGSITGSSCNSFAFCLGGGISMGRVSLTARWLTSGATYSRDLSIAYLPFGSNVSSSKYDQTITVILIGFGVTII